MPVGRHPPSPSGDLRQEEASPNSCSRSSALRRAATTIPAPAATWSTAPHCLPSLTTARPSTLAHPGRARPGSLNHPSTPAPGPPGHSPCPVAVPNAPGPEASPALGRPITRDHGRIRPQIPLPDPHPRIARLQPALGDRLMHTVLHVLRHTFPAPVAQRIEQPVSTRLVGGSSPPGAQHRRSEGFLGLRSAKVRLRDTNA